MIRKELACTKFIVDYIHIIYEYKHFKYNWK